MVKVNVTAFTNSTQRDAAFAAAQTLSETLHKFQGGDRAETGAVGIGPTARAWLAANGPPLTTGYSTPVLELDDPDDPEGSGEVRLAVAADALGLSTMQTRLNTHGMALLTGTERAAVQTAINGVVDRVNSNQGAVGLGRDTR
jgi:hypothetical protein